MQTQALRGAAAPQARDLELYAARVEGALAGLDAAGVHSVLVLVRQRLEQRTAAAQPAGPPPKYLVRKNDGARPRVLGYSEALFKTGMYEPLERLPEYHVQAIAVQAEHDRVMQAAAEAARARLAAMEGGAGGSESVTVSPGMVATALIGEADTVTDMVRPSPMGKGDLVRGEGGGIDDAAPDPAYPSPVPSRRGRGTRRVERGGR